MSQFSYALRAAAGLIVSLIFGLVFATGAMARGHHDHRHDEVRHFATHSGLHFYAGGDVDFTEAAETAFVAGGTVKVSSHDVGEIIAAGGTVKVPDTKTNRIIAAGGTVDILNSEIAKTVIASGGTVKVRDSKVTGDVILSGGDVDFKGDVGGDFIGTAGEVELAGQFGGDVTIRDGKIKLAPETRIAGNLTYAARDELTVPAGMVTGTVTRQDWGHGGAWYGEMNFGKMLAFGALALVGGIVALFIFAGVVLAFFSRYVGNAASTITEQPLQSLGLGVLLAIVLPITIIVLFITIIGIPLGLFTMALYGVLFGLGIVVAAYWLGMKLRHAFGYGDQVPRYATALGWTLLGLIVFSLIGVIPLVGTLAQFFALVTGFGAFVLAASGITSRPQIAA